ncbi:phage portal protein [Rhizobium rhizogenes]|uniref:phage portal protein n=1 Tax=Rhizobium rhizogenes TaxID=359 RepID=UPI0024BE096C|nr:phage portal protein [Rhizobium rhizogenes]MDJ1632514.1 phage portal protein [Rhizobium rhizogenes]
MKLWPFYTRKSLTNPTPEEEALFTGTVVGSSVVSTDTALTVPAVQSCIRLIAEAAAALEIRVEKKTEKGWEVDTSHPVAALLADQPNEWSSTFDLIRDIVATALTTDKGALAWVNKVGNEVREIVRYEPANYQIDYSTDGRSEPSFKVNNLPVDAGDVIFIRSPFSRSPLSLASDAINAAKAMETHAKRLFENGARPSGVVESPKPIGDSAAKKMITAFKAAFLGADKAGGVPILWDGTTFRPLTLNSTDAQFLENRKYQTLEICRAFRVPPSMIFEMDRATWNNAEQAGQEFLVYCLEPWLSLIETAMRRALFTAAERKSYRIRLDRDDLTRADLTARATAISTLVSAKVLNPNEARSWLDLPPYDGGNEYGNPHINPNAPGPGHNGGPPLDDKEPAPNGE